MKTGRRIYYDKKSGEVLYDSGESIGSVTQLSVEDEISNIKALSERNRETFDFIQMEYEELARDFKEATSYKVDVESKEIVFNFENPSEVPVYRESLTKEVKRLEDTVTELDELLLEMLYEGSVEEALGGM